MSIKYENLDMLKAYRELQNVETSVDLKEELKRERILKYSAPTGGGLTYNYAAKAVNDEIINILQRLSEEQQLISKYKEVLNGEFINTGENRKVLHHLTRGKLGSDVTFEDKNLREFYVEQQNRIRDFSAKVHAGEIKGSTGQIMDTVVQIGIGGSDLGPRAMYIALENIYKTKMEAHFISNVDPDDANTVLGSLNFEKTLFILVSKSGTTQETLANRNFVLEKTKQAHIHGFNPSKHMVAVTSESSPLAGSDEYLDSFYMDDFIGGRYSSTSAVGGVVLSMAFGSEIFDQFLAGANDADKSALETDIRKNGALMDALIGVYERNILGFGQTAVLPYSQALSRFPAHLQQMDMESNGKSVNRRGEPLDYQTGPVIFGEPGTNGQHSFYQLLHQGTDIVPLQFIGFRDSQIPFDLDYEGSNSQQKLKANLVAQIIAFAKGKEDSNSNKRFAGQRPSSLIYGSQLTARSLGALLAHFENKVMFQGFIWNINSFDQEGVQLGKILAKQVLAGGDDMDEALKTYSELMEI